MSRKLEKKTWGKMQQDCHKWVGELFENRDRAYAWLYKKFGIHHFSELDNKKDEEILTKIYKKLYRKAKKITMTHPTQRECC